MQCSNLLQYAVDNVTISDYTNNIVRLLTILNGGKIMNSKEILKHVDHTLLAAYSKWDQIEALCDEAIEKGTASVCVPPCYISRIHEKYGSKVNICAVIGFPLGYSVTEAKVAEAKKAVEDGVNEIDMVINITDAKNHDFAKIENEIRTIKQAVGNKILKVIIETCYLTDDEKIEICKAVTKAKADFIKTSTGFGTAGATIEDIRLFKKHIGPDVKMKAAGGIKTVADMEMYINEGCERLGTSSAVKILAGLEAKGY